MEKMEVVEMLGVLWNPYQNENTKRLSFGIHMKSGIYRLGVLGIYNGRVGSDRDARSSVKFLIKLKSRTCSHPHLHLLVLH